GRSAQARVLRKADPGAQAQARRRGQASPASRFARRDQAPAPVLSAAGPSPCRTPGAVATGRGPNRAGTRKRRRLFVFPAPDGSTRDPTAAARCGPHMVASNGAAALTGTGGFAMSLKQKLTDDMKAAMKGGDKERLGVIRLVNAAIKQRE